MRKAEVESKVLHGRNNGGALKALVNGKKLVYVQDIVKPKCIYIRRGQPPWSRCS